MGNKTKTVALPDISSDLPAPADLPISEAEKRALLTQTQADWLPRIQIAQRSSDCVGDKHSGIGFTDIYMKHGDDDTLLAEKDDGIFILPIIMRPKAMLISGGEVEEESYDPESEAFAKCVKMSEWGPHKVPGAYSGVEFLVYLAHPEHSCFAAVYFTGTSKRSPKKMFKHLGKMARLTVKEKPGSSGPYGVWICEPSVEVSEKDIEGIDFAAMPTMDEINAQREKYVKEPGRSHREDAGTTKDDGAEEGAEDRE